MRAGPLSDEKVVSLLNSYFVPVYVSNDDYDDKGPAPAAEKVERRRIMMEARQANLSVGTVCVYLLGPDGKVIDTCRVPQANDTKYLIGWLEGTHPETGHEERQLALGKAQPVSLPARRPERTP